MQPMTQAFPRLPFPSCGKRAEPMAAAFLGWLGSPFGDALVAAGVLAAGSYRVVLKGFESGGGSHTQDFDYRLVVSARLRSAGGLD